MDKVNTRKSLEQAVAAYLAKGKEIAKVKTPKRQPKSIAQLQREHPKTA